MKKMSLFILLFFGTYLLWGQKSMDSLTITFQLKWGSEILTKNKKYYSKTNDSIQIHTLKFYISNLQIEFEDHSQLEEKNKYHLIDLDSETSTRIAISEWNPKKVKKIYFNIGVDSLTSVSGALNGDLDPTKGMYWAWQSGYINMKIEGKSTKCKTRNHAFQFHIGGYLKPYYALRKVNLDIKNSNLNIAIDLHYFFENLTLSQTNSVMIPCSKAMELADQFNLIFKPE